MIQFYWDKFIKYHKLRIGSGIFCFILSSAAGLMAPLIIKLFIDDALAKHNTGVLMLIVYAIIIIYMVRAVFAWAYSLLMSKLGNSLIMELRSYMYRKLNQLRFSYFIDKPAGNAISVFTEDLAVVQQAIVVSIPDLIVEILSLLAIFSIMIFLNWRLAIITILTLPFIIVLIQHFNRRIAKLAEKIDESQKGVVALLQQTIMSIMIVQSYVRQEYEYRRFNKKIEQVTDSLVRIQHLNAAFIPLVEFMAAIGLTIIIWWGGREVVFGNMSLGDMFAFLIYIINVPAPVRKLTEATAKLRVGMIAWRRIDKLTEDEETVDDNGSVEAELVGNIEFRDVCFGYNEHSAVLKNFSLAVNKGDFLVVVGASGAGKSTIANLLLRFYETNAGCISFDGRDIETMKLSCIRRQIGFIQQDSLLFSCTILENIRYGRPEISLDSVHRAAKIADAHNFIIEQPHGYNTRLSEGGTNLSGGQRQRIAIARALLIDPPILLLDEPTSTLDSKSERQVMQAVRRASKGRTTILITHRLSVIEPDDQVVYVENGKIVESGIYERLLANEGPFARAVSFWEQDDK